MNDNHMPHGIYPMPHAFFNAQGGLDKRAIQRQVQAFVDHGAHGMAVLGLGTEVNKLSDIERRQLVDWVAIQNAPEYLGVGLTPVGVKTLARNHPNFRILKGEGPALTIRQVIEETGDSVTVFNGRGGLELVDNLRAGCAGMIPASDTFDRAPALRPSAFGMRCAQRYAAALGPLE